ncbi:MAG: tyrosine-type recombinase/integrase [Limimaricola soesokkakensis]|uniref:tyrosine-type recombinase/integrase n=1 Tax=Limimaricola soesokkakensis TaxID=1343159 RepID=UPI0040598F1E
MDRETFLQTAYGKPRSVNGFGNAVRKWCDDAGLPDCTAHGLRKACARRLAEASQKEQELAAVLGYASSTTPHTFTGMGERASMASSAIAALQN